MPETVGMNPKLNVYFNNVKQWKKEFVKFREIALGFPLSESLKWRWPCYALDEGNVFLMHGFKEHCDLLFFKGALLKDAKGILVKPGENTQAGRQMRFTGVRDIVKTEATVKAYIKEAIAIEKAGLKVELKKSTELKLPEELKKKFAELPALKTAFYALTPGRQRAYNFHFTQAKQSQTREARIEKCVKQILEGRGFLE
jgi:uncharacterized protein YdeI (YjbR/CyaY-like superfamily)